MEGETLKLPATIIELTSGFIGARRPGSTACDATSVVRGSPG